MTVAFSFVTVSVRRSGAGPFDRVRRAERVELRDDGVRGVLGDLDHRLSQQIDLHLGCALLSRTSSGEGS